MAFLFKPMRCPYCNNPMDKNLLRQKGLLETFLQRKPFACPHCAQSIKLPEQAEKLVSVGLFTVIFLGPMFYFWPLPPFNPQHIFAIGLLITCIGIWQQKLVKA